MIGKVTRGFMEFWISGTTYNCYVSEGCEWLWWLQLHPLFMFAGFIFLSSQGEFFFFGFWMFWVLSILCFAGLCLAEAISGFWSKLSVCSCYCLQDSQWRQDVPESCAHDSTRSCTSVGHCGYPLCVQVPPWQQHSELLQFAFLVWNHDDPVLPRPGMIYSSTFGAMIHLSALFTAQEFKLHPYSPKVHSCFLLHILCISFRITTRSVRQLQDCVRQSSNMNCHLKSRQKSLSKSLLFAVDPWIRSLLDTECFFFPACGTSAMAHLHRACCICGSSRYSRARIAREAHLPSKEFSTCRLLVWRGHARELHWHCSLCVWGSCDIDSSVAESPPAGRV